MTPHQKTSEEIFHTMEAQLQLYDDHEHVRTWKHIIKMTQTVTMFNVEQILEAQIKKALGDTRARFKFIQFNN